MFDKCCDQAALSDQAAGGHQTAHNGGQDSQVPDDLMHPLIVSCPAVVGNRGLQAHAQP